MKKYIIFDVGGTLIDTCNASFDSFNYVTKKYNLFPSLRKYETMLDGPMIDFFYDIFGFCSKHCKNLSDEYYSYFKNNQIKECVPFDGMRELIDELVNKGVRLFAVSSYKESVIKLLMEQTKLEPYFSMILGASTDGVLSSKEDLISKAIKDFPLKDSDKKDIVYIGDQRKDKLAAKINKIDFICAGYGYGDEEFLESMESDKIAENVKKLKDMLL